MKTIRTLALILFATVLVVKASSAQTPAKDPSVRLKEVLPADVAQRVLALISIARAHQLPADALENRALKFAAKGVDPKDIERSVREQADRMEKAKTAIAIGRGKNPSGDEIEAGAEAMRKGVDAPSVSMLAKSAPKRSLAVPLFVIGSLTDRGIPSDQAVKRVMDRLRQRASDTDLESMPGELPNRPAGGQTERKSDGAHTIDGRIPAASGRPAGPPGGVPANGGAKSNPGRIRKTRR